MSLDMVQLAVGLVVQEIGFVYWSFHRRDDFRDRGEKVDFKRVFYDFPSENIFSQYPQCMACTCALWLNEHKHKIGKLNLCTDLCTGSCHG
jgi:hypothetical protein